MNDQLSNNIQEQINTEEITPLPRWRFLVLRGVFGLLALLSVVVGSFSVGTMLFLFGDYHRHGLLAIPHELTEFLLMMPYLWIITFILFVAIGELSIKHTRNGYRYSLRVVVSVSIMLSIVFGSILNVVGLGRMTHEFLRGVPLYHSVTYDSKDAWDRPVIGRLAGVVVSVQDERNFSIRDFSGRVWQVRLATSTRDSFIPQAQATVRMFGLIQASSSVFVAGMVREWEQ